MENKQSGNNWRFERKYALTTEEFIQFEKLLMRSNLEPLHADRSINNCYLDNINNNSLSESIEGYSEKMKIRLRWYGELFQTTSPKLEFKIKQNHSNRKELFKLPRTNISKTTNWLDYIQEIRRYLLLKYNFHLLDSLEPVLINSYDRSYYSDFEKTFRLTIDKNLHFMSPTGHLKNSRSYGIDRYIIELKFSNEENIKNFPIYKNLGKFSKFTIGRSILS